MPRCHSTTTCSPCSRNPIGTVCTSRQQETRTARYRKNVLRCPDAIAGRCRLGRPAPAVGTHPAHLAGRSFRPTSAEPARHPADFQPHCQRKGTARKAELLTRSLSYENNHFVDREEYFLQLPIPYFDADMARLLTSADLHFRLHTVDDMYSQLDSVWIEENVAP